MAKTKAQVTPRKSVSTDPTTPPLADDLPGLRKEIDERFDLAKDHQKDWKEQAEDDYRFLLGDQWTEDERTTLTAAGRPCLTFNRIRPLFNIVSGYQRENTARLKVHPEGGEDVVFSEVIDRAMKYGDKLSHLTYKSSYWFDDGVAVGKGWLEAIRIYDHDPIRGDLDYKLRSPSQILIDPDFNEYDLNDGCQFLFKIVRLTRGQLIELFPKKKALIEGFVTDEDDDEARATNGSALIAEGHDDDYGNRPNPTTRTRRGAARGRKSELEEATQFTVKEYWRPQRVEKFFVIDVKTGEPVRFDTGDLAEAFASGQKRFKGKVVPRMLNEMHTAIKVAGYILQDEKSDFEPLYNGYPFFRYIGDWSPNAETEALRVQGIVRPLNDPQREKNKAKSQHLHILSTQANSGWIGDTNALTDEGWKALKEMGSKPGIVIQKTRGAELREILPKGPNAAHLQREDKADDEFKQIASINPDLMGFQEGTTSGKAISMRIKQAILSLVRLFHNYRYSKEILGKFILQTMPLVFDAKKLEKVIGVKYMQTAVNGGPLTPGTLAGYLTLVKDHKYDVQVTEADNNATIRAEIRETLTELAQAKLPVPLELIIDYMDLPNSAEAKGMIQAEQQRQMAAAMAAKGASGAGPL